MSTTALEYATASELVAGYRAGRFSPAEALEAVLARIDAVEPQLNAWQLLDAAAARRAARAASARWAKGRPRGLLDGVPVAIKDVTETRGWPTRNGSLAIDPRGPWEEDAVVTERFRAHGALLLGKTATPEFAWKGHTRSALAGVTRNPWNPAWTPCGSSGGSGAAVAAGMVAIATGTDSGGSIRGPASFCRVVGLKPTFGRVPVWPASPMMMLEHCGPLARSVRDCALAMRVMAGYDPRDGYALAEPAPDFLSELEDGVEGLRIAYSPDLGFARVAPEVLRIAGEAPRVFTDLGARVTRVKQVMEDPFRTAKTIGNALAARLARALGRRRERLSEPELLDAAAAGERLDAAGLLEAESARRDLCARMAAFHARYDLLLTPGMCAAPFDLERGNPPGRRGRSAGRWFDTVFPFDLSGQPAIVVPCGFTPEGGPVGLQIVGPRGGDALVLRAARAFERAHPVHPEHPPLQATGQGAHRPSSGSSGGRPLPARAAGPESGAGGGGAYTAAHRNAGEG